MTEIPKRISLLFGDNLMFTFVAYGSTLAVVTGFCRALLRE